MDDQSYNIKALEIILKTRFALNVDKMVVRAFHGRQAVEMVEKNLRAHNYSSTSLRLILMDINMPFMDGIDATVKIFELCR